MSDEVLVRVENISKRFCRSLKRSLWYGMQDLGSELTGHRHGGGSGLPQSSADIALRQDEFWAVKDVSFELRRGECLGLIGRNGAGKTTLLRMLNGLIKPDTGRIEMRGKVGALIALGAGFNPILTGRENIYINGSVLGYNRSQLDEKVEEIVDFAEISDFIDSPVQSYSSGMNVRLGFAIASSLEPDILILDEVLAVGDAAFRHKCYRRIDEMRSKSAVVFVSHDMGQISRMCSSAILFHEGKISFMGGGDDAALRYENLNHDQSANQKNAVLMKPPIESVVTRLVAAPTMPGDSLHIELDIKASETLSESYLVLNVVNLSGSKVASLKHNVNKAKDITVGKNRFRLEVGSIPLKNGRYTVGILIVSEDTGKILYSGNNIESFEITDSDFLSPSQCILQVTCWEKL